MTRVGYPHLSTTGRLGNQLWEIASTIGLARKEQKEPWFPIWDYQQFFRVPEQFFSDHPGQRGHEIIFFDAINMVPHMDQRAAPYLQDYNLFKDVDDEIKGYFEPSDQACAVLRDIWNDHFSDLPQPVISVHVRRGDNVTHPEGYHPLRSMAYYRRAFDSLDETEDEGSIVVFSDDPQWCKANFERETGTNVAVFYEGVGRPREYVDRQLYLDAPILDWIDLQLMAACDRHILSNSTYAWWGAFLSQDPQPIYPSNWFGHQIAPWTDASLMFPDQWLQVHDETEGGI